MNPFSRFLTQWSGDASLKAFVAHWDLLEALVIRVYKGAAASEDDDAQWREHSSWLRERYPPWRQRLAPHWRQATVGGEPAKEDPFLRLLSAERAAEFVGDWQALQNLPAAREALNRLLLEA